MNPPISYIICSQQRSGTHLLGDALQQTGIAGRPDDYCMVDEDGRMQNQQGNLADLYGKKDLFAFRDLVWELGSTPNGVFGITIMASYREQMARHYRRLPPYKGLNTYEVFAALFNNPKYIWLVRRDKVKQAISQFKAEQSGVWIKPADGQMQQTQQTTIFDYAFIEYLRRRFVAGDAAWEAYFRRYGIEPLKLFYEDLADDFAGTAVAVLDFLGLSLPENVTLQNSRLQKQANQINEVWERQYYQIHNPHLPRLSVWRYTLRVWVGRVTLRRWLRQSWCFFTNKRNYKRMRFLKSRSEAKKNSEIYPLPALEAGLDVHDVTLEAAYIDLSYLDVVTWTPAFMTRAERLLLYTLVFTLRPLRYLEIGTLHGGSALMVAAAMDALNSHGRLVCVDPNPKIEPENWQRIEHRATLLNGYSPAILPQAQAEAGGPFDFVLIDGDHSAKGVLRDARGVLPHVANGAYLLFHDSFNPDVAQGLAKFAAEQAAALVDFGSLTREATFLADDKGNQTRWGGLRMMQVRRS